MTHNTIRTSTPPSTIDTSSQMPSQGGQLSRQPVSQPAGPISSGRNAGGAGMGGRVSLSALPGRAIQKVMGELPLSTRNTLSLTGRAMAAHAAIACAQSEHQFESARQALGQLTMRQHEEACVALADRFEQEVTSRCRRRVDGELQLLSDDILRISETTFQAMKALPVDSDRPFDTNGLRNLGQMSRSMLSAQSAMVGHTLLYPASQAQRRDDTHAQVSSQLKGITDLMKVRQIVKDEVAMKGVLDDFLGPKGTVFSAQTAFSQLPQQARDLPAPEGNEQTVRMMTKMADMATRNAGLTLLKSDPTWADTLISGRINVVLKGKHIDANAHPKLKAALDRLEHKRDELIAAQSAVPAA